MEYPNAGCDADAHDGGCRGAKCCDQKEPMIAKAPTPEQILGLRAKLDEIRRAPSRPFQEIVDYAPRADRFDQRRIDEIKASLLTDGTASTCRPQARPG